MGVIACGPFVGSFEQEILMFRPFVKWLSENLKYDSLVVSTHSNRQFMYNDVPNIVHVPIDEKYSLSENRQFGLLNTNLTKKEYSDYTKELLGLISDKLECTKKSITQYPIMYIQSTTQYSSFQKSYTKIPVPRPKDIKKKAVGCILFIPDVSETEERNLHMYELLKKEYGVDRIMVVGDTRTHLKNKNVIMKRDNYFSDVYKCLFKWIDECDIVVCPASYWTFLVKHQEAGVFSWGNVAQYKGYDPLSCLLASSKDIKIEKIFDQFRWYMSKRGETCV